MAETLKRHLTVAWSSGAIQPILEVPLCVAGNARARPLLRMYSEPTMNKIFRELRFAPGAELGEVSAILGRSDACRTLLVLGHGSGSNMRVPFIEGLSTALVDAGVATFRYQYPYSESRDFVPYSDIPTDPPEVLLATVRSAVAAAAAAARATGGICLAVLVRSPGAAQATPPTDLKSRRNPR